MKYPYVSQFVTNRGKPVARGRKNGRSRYFKSLPGEAGFDDEYAAFLTATKQPQSGGKCPPKGSLSALIVEYYRSTDFIGVKASTKRTYRSVIEPLRAQHGDKPVALLERRHIKSMMAEQSGPGAANKVLRYFRLLLEYAVELEWIASNPARGIKKMKVDGEGFAEWPEAEIERFEAHWPLGSKPRLAFDLLLFTGQRRSDVVAMMRSHVRDGEIRVIQQKTGQPLWLPIHPRLAASIAASKLTGLAFLETDYRRPFTAAGFGNWFRAKCDVAGVPKGFSAHGLRKAAGRRLADGGCTASQIMAVLGHRSLSEATRYTRGADQRRNAQAAIARIGTEDERELSSAPVGVSSKRAK